MSFMRPEAVAAVMRWREALAGGVVGAFGVWMMATQLGFYVGAGAVIAGIGAALAFTGVRHARFRAAGDAPGVVEVVEGRVTYLGPILGGAVALDDLTAVTFRRTATGEAFWRLESPGTQALIIPAGARGVDQLLDAFTVLPRIDTGLMVKAVQSRTPITLTIWRQAGVRALT